jgi:hypothetical protein
VCDERGAECREQYTGGAMVNPLAADPHAPATQVEAD